MITLETGAVSQAFRAFFFRAPAFQPSALYYPHFAVVATQFVAQVEHSELDYATEKLFDPLMHDSVIPIYLGPPNEREFLSHPSAALLVRDFSAKKGENDTDVVVDEETMRRVARYVASVSRNASAMRQLRSWRTEELDGTGSNADHRRLGNMSNNKDIDDFPLQLRSWFSHRQISSWSHR